MDGTNAIHCYSTSPKCSPDEMSSISLYGEVPMWDFSSACRRISLALSIFHLATYSNLSSYEVPFGCLNTTAAGAVANCVGFLAPQAGQVTNPISENEHNSSKLFLHFL